MNIRIVLLGISAIIGIVLYFYYGIYKNLFIYINFMGSDFIHGYDSALRYLDNQPLYFDLNDTRTPFLYTPLALIIFLPFTSLTSHQAVIIWFVVCHAMVLLSAWILYRMGRLINKQISVLVTIVVIGFCTPLYVALHYGNINILILLSFCMLYYCLLHGRKMVLVCILAAGTYLKIFPALYMVIFLRSKNWKLIGLFIIYLCLFGVLSLFCFGPEVNINYIKSIIPNGMKWSGIVPAMSFSYFVKLHFSIHSDIHVFIVNILFGLFLLNVWWFRGEKISDKDKCSSILPADLLVLPVVMVILFPASWLQYHLYFIVTFYFILFCKLHYKTPFKHFSMFIIIFMVINFWQIIIYHLPITSDGITMMDVFFEKNKFPFIYRITYSMPFILNISFFIWLVMNYRILCNAMKDFGQ